MWAATQLRHRAPALYYAPQLWGTTDGVVPYRRFWAEYVAMTMQTAHERWERMSAFSLAMSGPEGQPAREQTMAAAFPAFVDDRRDAEARDG